MTTQTIIKLDCPGNARGGGSSGGRRTVHWGLILSEGIVRNRYSRRGCRSPNRLSERPVDLRSGNVALTRLPASNRLTGSPQPRRSRRRRARGSAGVRRHRAFRQREGRGVLGGAGRWEHLLGRPVECVRSFEPGEFRPSGPRRCEGEGHTQTDRRDGRGCVWFRFSRRRGTPRRRRRRRGRPRRRSRRRRTGYRSGAYPRRRPGV